MQHAKAGDPIARIFDEPQQRERVLDVTGVKKFEAAEFHERDNAAGEFDFQRAAMRGRPEKHRLLLEKRSYFAVFKDLLDDVARLVGLVAHGDKARLCRGGGLRPKVLGEPFPGKIDDAIRRRQDWLRRTVVAVESDDPRVRAELPRKFEDVGDRGGTKGINRLCVVTDDREPVPSRLHCQHLAPVQIREATPIYFKRCG